MDYFFMLFTQFNEAKGYKKFYFNSINYLNEFSDWLYSLNKQSSQYSDFALFNHVVLRDSIELNKGRYDSISNNNVSPFFDDPKKIIMCQGKPYICGSKVVKGQVVDTYSTHNPYNVFYFGNLVNLHNSSYSICFGVFGNNNDCNKDSKVKFFKSVVDSLNDNFVCDYTTIGDSYFYIVFSKKKVLKKVLCKR